MSGSRRKRQTTACKIKSLPLAAPPPGAARAWLLCSTAILLAGALALAPPAWAADECGAITAGSVTCTPAGNNYTSGITYTPAQDLTMVVEDGVTVITSTSNLDAITVNFSTMRLNDVDLRVYDTDTFADITTTGAGADGIFVNRADTAQILNYADIDAYSRGIFVSTSRDVTITNLGDIVAGYRGIDSFINIGDVTIYNYADITSDRAGIIVRGTSTLRAQDVWITNEGSIDASEASSPGISISNLLYTATVYNRGYITTFGNTSDGIVINQNYGATSDLAKVVTTGTIRTEGYKSRGIYLNTPDKASITVSGTYGDPAIITTGTDYIATPASTSKAHGIYIKSAKDYAKVSIGDYAEVETYGRQAHGMYILNTGDGGGTDYVDVTLDGDIVTHGNDSHGAYVRNTNGAVTIDASGDILASGSNSKGIVTSSTTGNVNIDLLGLVNTVAEGVHVQSTTGNVDLDVSGTILTSGSRPTISRPCARTRRASPSSPRTISPRMSTSPFPATSRPAAPTPANPPPAPMPMACS